MEKIKYDITCLVCKKKFKDSRKNRIYCSKKCSSKNYLKGSSFVNISAGTIGAITELEVSNILLKDGYAVFRALSPASFCDIIAVKGKKVKTIQGGQKGTKLGGARTKAFLARHGNTTAKQYINDLRWKGGAKIGSTITIPKGRKI